MNSTAMDRVQKFMRTLQLPLSELKDDTHVIDAYIQIHTYTQMICSATPPQRSRKMTNQQLVAVSERPLLKRSGTRNAFRRATSSL